MAEAKQTIKVGFEMEDHEGTAPLRVVAGHARRVGEGWVSIGQSMDDLADSLDALVAGGDVEMSDG